MLTEALSLGHIPPYVHLRAVYVQKPIAVQAGVACGPHTYTLHNCASNVLPRPVTWLPKKPTDKKHVRRVVTEALQGFFRRSQLKTKNGTYEYESYRCSKSKDCAINVVTRNLCRYCRYAKCLAVGMSKEGIRMGRQPNYLKHGVLQQLQSPSSEGNGHNFPTSPPIPTSPNIPTSPGVPMSPSIPISPTSSTHHSQQQQLSPVDNSYSKVSSWGETQSTHSSMQSLPSPHKSYPLSPPPSTVHMTHTDMNYSSPNAAATVAYSNVNSLAQLLPTSPTSPNMGPIPTSHFSPMHSMPTSPPSLMHQGPLQMHPSPSTTGQLISTPYPGPGQQMQTGNMASPIPYPPVEHFIPYGPASGVPPTNGGPVDIAEFLPVEDAFKYLNAVRELPEGGRNLAEHELTVENIWEKMMLSFKRNVHVTTKFAKKIPGFRTCSIDDQISMIQGAAFPINSCILALDYNPVTNEMNYFNMTEMERTAMPRLFPPFAQLPVKLPDIWKKILALRMNKAEMTLFCGILLMSPDTAGLKDPKGVEMLQGKLYSILEKYTLAQGVIGGVSGVVRFQAMLQAIMALKKLNEEHAEKTRQITKVMPYLKIPQLFSELHKWGGGHILTLVPVTGKMTPSDTATDNVRVVLKKERPSVNRSADFVRLKDVATRGAGHQIDAGTTSELHGSKAASSSSMKNCSSILPPRVYKPGGGELLAHVHLINDGLD
ncbi:hypothetical protein Bbelb_073440 [Branchiostoma belcheri]|nr:hypothetical protein Bbelb_073440 [Branchiostoma belcheri]